MSIHYYTLTEYTLTICYLNMFSCNGGASVSHSLHMLVPSLSTSLLGYTKSRSLKETHCHVSELTLQSYATLHAEERVRSAIKDMPPPSTKATILNLILTSSYRAVAARATSDSIVALAGER